MANDVIAEPPELATQREPALVREPTSLAGVAAPSTTSGISPPNASRRPECFPQCVGVVACGNGALDPGEDCEGLDLGGATCVSLGFDAGVLACGADCSFDTTGCTDAPAVCLEFEDGGQCTDPALCSCVGCNDDGECGLDDDCVCTDCAGQAFCGCADDGVCDVYNEGCVCADCAAVPQCDDGPADDFACAIEGDLGMTLGANIASGSTAGLGDDFTISCAANGHARDHSELT